MRRSNCGGYCSEYRYTPVASLSVTINTPPPDYTESWRKELLAWARDRDTRSYQVQRSAQEHNEWLEAVRVLGADQYPQQYNMRLAGSPYSFGQQQQYQPNAGQGSTVWNYNGLEHSVKRNLDIYGKSNVDAWMQSLSRGQLAAQQTADKGLNGIYTAIDKETSSKERVALMLAKSELLRAAEDSVVKVREEFVKYTNSPATLQAAADSHTPARLHDLLANRCMRCHNATQHPGRGVLENGTVLFPNGVNLEEFNSYTHDQKRHVINVCLTGDMPRDDKALDVDEMTLFFGDLLRCGAAAQLQ